jgi:hypothetical protein
MKPRILVIGPNDSADRVTRVAQALVAKRPDLSPTTPAEILGGEQHWLPAYQQALRYAAAIVCVPRHDVTIGSDTLHDLVQAYEAAGSSAGGMPARASAEVGAAGLAIIRMPRTSEEVQVWKKRAPSVSTLSETPDRP